MKIKVTEKISCDTRFLIRFFLYLNTLIRKHKMSGGLTFTNLINKKIAKRYGFWDERKGRMSNTFYNYVNAFIKMGILTETGLSLRKVLAREYYINKELFFLYFVACTIINSKSKKQLASLTGLKSTFVDLVNAVYRHAHKQLAFTDTSKFEKFVVELYKTSYFMLASNIKCKGLLIKELEHYMRNILHSEVLPNDDVLFCRRLPNDNHRIPGLFYGFISYVGYHYINKLKFINIESESLGHINAYLKCLKNNTVSGALASVTYNKGSQEKYPFYKSLNMALFTDKFLGKERTTLDKKEEYYERKLSRNQWMKPLIVILNMKPKQSLIDGTDLEIYPDDLQKIPGIDEESKIKLLEDVVRRFMISKSPFLNWTLHLVEELKGYRDNYRMNVNVKTTKRISHGKVIKYIVHTSGRMTNDSCFIEKERGNNKHYRDSLFAKEGLDNHYDVSGTIFLISKALNYHEKLDLSYDIKQEMANLLIKGYINGEYRTLTRNDFKGIGFFIFFARDEDDAWNNYKNRFNAAFFSKYLEHNCLADALSSYDIQEMEKNIPDINESDFRKIYQFVQRVTGGTIKYRDNVFIIESAIEALVVSELLSQEEYIKNVYDCIYYGKPLNEQYIKYLFVQKADIVFRKYYEIVGETKHVYLNDYTAHQISA